MTKPIPRMNSWAARSLLEEIAQLRDDIHRQNTLLHNCELLITAVYCDLHDSNRARLPQP